MEGKGAVRMIRLPRLLDSAQREKARLQPVKLSLHLSLSGLSTAEMLLPPDAPEIALRDLVELYDEQGSVGVFRVTAVETDETHVRQVKLTHGLCTLGDSVIPAQGFMGSVAEALARLLDFQTTPLWAPGNVEAPDDLTVIFATEYASLLDALNALLGMLPEGYALDFDQSAMPWQLHIRALTDTPFCEGRLRRNVGSVRHQVDGSRLCTRVYPFGAEVDTGRITLVPLTGSDHLDSAAVQELGLISRTFQDDLIFDVPTLQSVAEMYLSRHSEPEITTVLTAADLSAATGESIDCFRVGRMCRLCLPDMGLTVQHRIVAIDKQDVYGAPGQAVVTLSNRMKQQSEEDEVAELVRLVTAGKLLGGTVTTVEERNYAHGTYTAPVVHYFSVEDWAALLDARVTFFVPAGATIRDVRVDGNAPADDEWKPGSFGLMPYLKRDELGSIAKGQHAISFLPYGSSASDSVGVTSTVTMTVIEKTTT